MNKKLIALLICGGLTLIIFFAALKADTDYTFGILKVCALIFLALFFLVKKEVSKINQQKTKTSGF